MSFQPRVPGPAYAVLLLILLQLQVAVALPTTLTARSQDATSGGGLTEPEKITLYVVAAVGGFFVILGVAIYILRAQHQKECQTHSQKITQSILKTIPIIQYHDDSTRVSSMDSDDMTKENPEKPRNTNCPICTEDFVENQILRILPCDHQYHTRCIEDWLSRGRNCPVCRVELKSPIKEKSSKRVDASDVEMAQPRGADRHAKQLHNRLLKHLYSVGLGQHFNFGV